MEEITVTNETRPSNAVVFGLIFEDRQIFKETVKCVLGDEINDETYVVSEKENRMGNSIYNKIRFDVYGESDKIYSFDMQTGYTNAMITNRLVYYACRAVGGQEVKKFEYGKLKMCVVTFIFERNSYKSNQFLTRYYMASEVDGKIVKYSDLLNIVELNLGCYKWTDNKNLNILCEFLRIQNNDNLKEFYGNHIGSEFGEELYNKYLKVVANKDRMERVADMQLYRDKIQLRYFTAEEADAMFEQFGEKIAKNLLMKNKLSIEEIAEAAELTVERVTELKEKLSHEQPY